MFFKSNKALTYNVEAKVMTQKTLNKVKYLSIIKRDQIKYLKNSFFSCLQGESSVR
jgi:hypothetical protein